jgi:hypothetical protein
MFKKILKKIVYFLTAIFVLAIVLLIYFNWPVRDVKDKAELGVTFSYKYSRDIGLNWQDNFLAILDDLKVKHIRLPVYWEDIEKRENQYNFSEIDWQVKEAAKRNVELILVLGQKVPRWPECFVPKWAKNNNEKRKQALLKTIEKTVKRYKKEDVIKFWQVENEPFLAFGICPQFDPDFLDQEIVAVKKIDPERKIIITDSGELSFWIQAAKRADVFGTTMYRTIWKEGFGYFTYPIGPRFFHFKKNIIKYFAHQNKAIVIELQTEPWVAGWTISRPLEEQFNSMNEEQLVKNVQFAKNSGFNKIYLWEAEWWYWLKTEKSYPGLWEQAKKIFERNK